MEEIQSTSVILVILDLFHQRNRALTKLFVMKLVSLRRSWPNAY